MTLDPRGERNLTDVLEERAVARGEQTFLVFEDGDGAISELTYDEFAAQVRRCARGLHELGIGRGDRVVVHLRNCPEVLIAWFALARLGAVFVPSNVANTASELVHILVVSAARLAITQPALLAAVEEAIADGDVRVVVARGEAGAHTPFADLLGHGDDAPRPMVGSDEVVELIFTSGTTRKPKAVMLTHSNCVRAGLDAVHCLWLDEGERCLTALPLFHVNAQAMSVMAALTVGGTLILVEEFRASRFWAQVRSHRATQTSLVAMQLRTLLAQAPDEGDTDHDVRRLFYAINVTDHEKERFEARYGVALINGYGLSEAMTLLTCAPVVGPRRWPSIGLPSAGRRIALVDDEGNEVATGEVGEIVAEGTPGRDIMLGYLDDPESTAEALRGGRLHTGDNAWADEQGFLHFFDRKKDMIKRAGENVSALEVEAALLEHPQIAEAAVVGVPDAIRDEAVAAVIVPAAAGAVTPEDVAEHCRARLARFKVPTVVRFADELPKTSIGKVRKDVLRKQLGC
ncbi:MAG: carnitine-CoA ligase [Solirubrobacteraceae bacterium]